MTTKSACDCCGKIAVLSRVEYADVEAHECAECQGYAADAFDHLLDEGELEESWRRK